MYILLYFSLFICQSDCLAYVWFYRALYSLHIHIFCQSIRADKFQRVIEHIQTYIILVLHQGSPTLFLELYHPECFHFNPNLEHLILIIIWLINWTWLVTTGVGANNLQEGSSPGTGLETPVLHVLMPGFPKLGPGDPKGCRFWFLPKTALGVPRVKFVKHCLMLCHTGCNYTGRPDQCWYVFH
jgi:hypothetical protein